MLTKVRTSFGGIDASRIEAFEARNNLALPNDYKDFLITDNGGQLFPLGCRVSSINQNVLVEILLGVDQEREFDLQGWLDEYSREMPPGFLVFALGAGSMLFTLGTQGTDSGVYLWDHAHRFAGSSEETGNTYKLATTFTEFLDLLLP